LSLAIRAIEEWPLMMETKQKEPIQIWGSLGVDNAQNHEIMKSRMAKCNQNNQDMQNEENCWSKTFWKFFSDKEEHSGTAENVFDIQLKRNLEEEYLVGLRHRWRWKITDRIKPKKLKKEEETRTQNSNPAWGYKKALCQSHQVCTCHLGF
jgi:hypothetical protein